MRLTIRLVIGLVVAGQAAVFAQAAPVPVSGARQDLQVLEQCDGAPPPPAETGIIAMLGGLLSDFKHLPSVQNIFIAGVGGGLALAVHPLDNSVNNHLVGHGWSKDVFTPGKYAGESYTLLSMAGAIYATGRLRDEPRVSHVGMDLLRSVAITEVLTETLKYSVRRERPDGSDSYSFPSGHSADTFAFATALERHLGWRGAVPAYLFASYVAASRLRENRHYLSDVVFGAAVGTIAGRTVTRHGRRYYADVTFVPGGLALVVARQRSDDSPH